MREKCYGKTASGNRCSNNAVGAGHFCHIDGHGPANAVDAYDAKIDEKATMTDDNNADMTDDVQSAFQTIAAAYEDDIAAYDEKTKVDNPADSASIAAVAFARKVAQDNAWRAAFGTCQVADCERGRHGFESKTCDQHDTSDIGDTSDTSDTSGGNALSDLTPEQIAALPESVVAEKLE